MLSSQHLELIRIELSKTAADAERLAQNLRSFEADVADQSKRAHDKFANASSLDDRLMAEMLEERAECLDENDNLAWLDQMILRNAAQVLRKLSIRAAELLKEAREK